MASSASSSSLRLSAFASASSASRSDASDASTAVGAVSASHPSQIVSARVLRASLRESDETQVEAHAVDGVEA
eukprot:6203858-Pleurochrysis_carterae.AAC.1